MTPSTIGTLLFCAVIFVLLASATTQAKTLDASSATYYVSETGNNTNSGTSPDSPFQTVSNAYRFCFEMENCEIRIADGVYPVLVRLSISNSTVLKNLRIVGSANTTLQNLRISISTPFASFSMESVYVDQLGDFSNTMAATSIFRNVTFVGRIVSYLSVQGGSLTLASVSMNAVCTRENAYCISAGPGSTLLITMSSITNNVNSFYNLITATTSFVTISDSVIANNVAQTGVIGLNGNSKFVAVRSTFDNNLDAKNQPLDIQCSGGSSMNFTGNTFVGNASVSCTSRCFSYGSIASSLPPVCRNQTSPSPSPSSPSPSPSNTPAPEVPTTAIIIAVSVIAGAIVVAIVVGVIIYFYRRQRAQYTNIDGSRLLG